MRRFLAGAWEVIEVILIAFVTVFIIRTFIAQPFLVSGASMEEKFEDGNYLLIDEVTYRFRQPQRGEVIVFRYPKNPKSFFIKRIIGMPEETVQIINNKVVISPPEADSFVLEEEYLSQDTDNGHSKEIKLGPKEYFVMGDNRENSFDSRNWGAIKESDIIGIVRLRLFPFNEFSVFTVNSTAN